MTSHFRSTKRLRDLRLQRWMGAHTEGDLLLRAGIRYSTITPERAEEIIADAQAGDIPSQSTLLLVHVGLVEMWARYVWVGFRRFARGFDIGDLRQVARMGLLRALVKYDKTRAKFSTYASWWIFHHLRRFVENNAMPVRLPVHAWAQYRSWKQRKQALQTHIREAMEAVYEDIDEVHVSSAPHDVEDRDRLRTVRKAIRALHKRGSLSDRDVEIIMRRYTDPGEALKEIGVSYGVSRERIRQLEEVALAKIKFAVEHPDSTNDPAISFHRISMEKARVKTQERAPRVVQEVRTRRHRTPTIKQTAAGRAFEAIRAARGPKKSAEASK